MKDQIEIDHPSFEVYIDLIQTAISNVSGGFFRISTTYEPSGIVRERSFCYELYHQIRLLMSERDPLSLNGEIDKRGHIDFDEEDRKNPDFVFHIPGVHTGNTIAIEAKGTLDRKKDISKDLSTLLTFTEKYQYQAGLFILYNHGQKEFLTKMKDYLIDLSDRPTTKSVFILAILSEGEAVEIEDLQSLIAKCG